MFRRAHPGGLPPAAAHSRRYRQVATTNSGHSPQARGQEEEEGECGLQPLRRLATPGLGGWQLLAATTFQDSSPASSLLSPEHLYHEIDGLDVPNNAGAAGWDLEDINALGMPDVLRGVVGRQAPSPEYMVRY